MNAFVLDASALIAMLKGERGAAKVAAAITSARMSVINYAEVVSHFVHAGMPDREVDAMLDPLPVELVPVDKALAQMAGRLRARTAVAGLSRLARITGPSKPNGQFAASRSRDQLRPALGRQGRAHRRAAADGGGL